MEKVSLYIPCYNAENSIRECLESVRGQTYPIDEIFVIDDGSTDRIKEIAAQYHVRIVKHSKNRGLAASRNTAFKEARNELIAAIDADCVAHPDWLGELMKKSSTPNVAGVGGKLVERYTSSPADQWRAVHMQQHWENEVLEGPPFLYGSNTLFKKSAVQSVGLYDEAFMSNYEDVDLSKRLYASGYRLIYTPHAFVEHLRKDTIRSALISFWHWCYYMHINPYNRQSKSRRVAARIAMARGIFVTFYQEDLKKRDFPLLFIDFLLVWYFAWQGINDCLKQAMKRRA